METQHSKGGKATMEFVCARVAGRQCVLGRASRLRSRYTNPLSVSSCSLLPSFGDYPGLQKCKSLETLLLTPGRCGLLERRRRRRREGGWGRRILEVCIHYTCVGRCVVTDVTMDVYMNRMSTELDCVLNTFAITLTVSRSISLTKKFQNKHVK